MVMLLIFFAAFRLFLYSAAPSFTSGDSGELLTAAWCLGVPHPPGYPVWTLLNHAFFVLFPVGPVDFRGAVVSSLLGALACALVGQAAVKITRSQMAGLCAGVAACLSKTLWEQSIIAEVYALNAALVGLSLVILARMCNGKRQQIPPSPIEGPDGAPAQGGGDLHRLSPSRERLQRGGYGRSERLLLQLTCLLLGIGLCVHYTSILVTIPVAIACLARFLYPPSSPSPSRGEGILRESPPPWRGRIKVGGAGFQLPALFLIGVTPLLAMVIRSHAQPVMNWQQPEVWYNLVAQVLRLQYHDVLTGAHRDFLRLMVMTPVMLLLFWGIGTLLLAIPGFFFIWRTSRCSGLAFLSIFILSGPCLVWLLNPSLERESGAVEVFVIPLGLAVAVSAGVAVSALARSKIFVRLGPGRWVPAVLVLSALLWSPESRREDWSASNYGRDLLKTVGRQGLLITGADHQSFPMAFLQEVEGQSRNVVLLDVYGDPRLPPWSQLTVQFQNSSEAMFGLRGKAVASWVKSDRGPVVVSTLSCPVELEGMRLVPHGLALRLQSSKTAQPWPLWQHYLGPCPLAPRDYGNDIIASEYSLFRGMGLLEEKKVEEAKKAFEEAKKAAWGVKELYVNIGNLWASNGYCAEAAYEYEEVLRCMDRDFEPAKRGLKMLERIRKKGTGGG